ncbi:uncharacterized protein ACWYII_020456 isoform 2-T2 [Salvelinus alpinus]
MEARDRRGVPSIVERRPSTQTPDEWSQVSKATMRRAGLRLSPLPDPVSFLRSSPPPVQESSSSRQEEDQRKINGIEGPRVTGGHCLSLCAGSRHRRLTTGHSIKEPGS